jgi:Mg2+ and Co2+ transporter CorA
MVHGLDRRCPWSHPHERYQTTIRAASGSAPPATSRLYGMNFRHLPELEWHFGYPLVLATMAVIC